MANFTLRNDPLSVENLENQSTADVTHEND
jgi:hypothetical protein